MVFRFLRLVLFGLSLFAANRATAQVSHQIWRDIAERSITAAKTSSRGTDNRTVVPQSYRTLQLNRPALESALHAVPPEFSVPMEISPEIEIPLPDGTTARFNLQESPVMEPELAAKFPEIKTYVGQGIDDPSATMRMDLTPHGFHAIILSPHGDVYLDPYWRDEDTNYVSYFKKDFVADKPFRCLVESDKQSARKKTSSERAAPQRPTGATLKKYRLALACTGEYAVRVCSPNAPTVSATLAAMITSVNRCSAIYERELSIRFSLVANDDLLIYLDGNTDPYTNDDGFTLLDENQPNVDSVIGADNYDFGHVFSTGGGGVAYLGVICDSSSRAGGVTGSPDPIGDPYDVDYVVHEMGHQFGADHTFNSKVGSCGGQNRNSDTAYETGSGITIMAYAGICGATNLAPNSDDYFHTASYEEIDTFTSGTGGACAVGIVTGNTPPTVGALPAYTIPVSTPFSLTASASDPDGDTLTYSWEEFDKGSPAQSTAAPSATSTVTPIFRSFAPTTNPTRFFPSLTYILNYGNNPPATLNNYATGEIMTTVARVMKYRITVRDNRAGGGGTNFAVATVNTTNPAAGAFAVTAFNTASTIAGGSLQTVTWSKGGSDLAPISCANVKISLSTDGGYTFPVVLASSVANSGSSSVTIPQIATTQARIKVEAVGNIFFDISDANFTITSTNNAPTLSISNSITVARGTLMPTVATIGTASDVDGDSLTVSVSNLPYRATITPTLVGNSISLSALVECGLVTTLTTRSYPFTLTLTDSHGATVSSTVNLIVTPNTTPVLGTYPSISLPQAGSGSAAPNAALTDANGNLLPAPYTILPTTLPGGGTIAIDQTTGVITATTTASSTTGLPTAVRVTALDSCGAAAITTSSIAVFAGNPAASYLDGYGLTGGNAAFVYDYDADGILNLMEYALRLDPTKASQAGLPVVIAKDYAGTRYLSMTFTRSAVASDITYLVEGSSDLINWAPLASSSNGAATSGPGFIAETGVAPNFTAEVRDTVPIDSATSSRFLRLRVTSP